METVSNNKKMKPNYIKNLTCSYENKNKTKEPHTRSKRGIRIKSTFLREGNRIIYKKVQ